MAEIYIHNWCIWLLNPYFNCIWTLPGFLVAHSQDLLLQSLEFCMFPIKTEVSIKKKLRQLSHLQKRENHIQFNLLPKSIGYSPPRLVQNQGVWRVQISPETSAHGSNVHPNHHCCEHPLPFWRAKSDRLIWNDFQPRNKINKNKCLPYTKNQNTGLTTQVHNNNHPNV